MIQNSEKYNKLGEERKELQRIGYLPEWYTTAAWQMFKSKYAVEGECAVKGRFETIAKTLSKHLPKKYREEFREKFFNVLWKGWLSPATPVLANTGADRGMVVSCSGGVVADNVDSFYENLREQANLSKHGFGCSASLDAIRPRGSVTKRGLEASGVVPVMDDFFTMASKISQGSTRRGATAMYLGIDHGDFDEVLSYLTQHTDGAHVGWLVRDAFIEKMKSGVFEANRRFTESLYTKLVTGKGYYYFVDKVNRARPQMYKDLGLEVKASNLCVAPETLVLTDAGHRDIASLSGERVNVWNGKEWSTVEITKTGENQELVKVTTDSGHSLECTPYHKFYVVKDYYGTTVEKRAHELRPGDKLIKLETPIIEGSMELGKAYTNGFFSGDGCHVGANSRVYLYGDKRALRGEFGHIRNLIVDEDREYFNVDGLKDKFFVPDADYTIESRLNWFAGLLDSDGTVARNGNSQCLQVTSINHGFLENIQLMLQTLGVSSKVCSANAAGYRAMPKNDGSGEMADYYCQETKRLLISGTGIVKLLNLGLRTKRLIISDHMPNRNAERFVKITGVEYTGRRDDTYCFTEPKRHMGVFNGILTGQCGEISLYSDDGPMGSFDSDEGGHSFSCVLSSMNVSKYDEWKDTDAVFIATVFLDCVVAEFLEQAYGVRGLEKVHRFTRKSRAIGLGELGFHTYLQRKRIPFESLEAYLLNIEIAKKLHDDSLSASKWLANVLGEPEWCKGYGVRNTHRIAYAPTKNTAELMGGVSESFSPDPAWVSIKPSAAGELVRIPPEFLNLLKEKGKYTEEVINSIIDNIGSCQHLDFLSDHEKAVFKHAFETDQMVILRMAAARQKYTCQSQSTNLFVHEDGDEERIAALHSWAFMNPNIHTLYYIYSRSGVTVQSASVCSSCEA
jgi:ribonucleoside-diphosphate reductase alpha chain